jgi:serine/threonine protein kinase
MKQIIVIVDDFKSLKNEIASIPKIFSSEGVTIYSGRNIVKSITFAGQEFIVKKFKPCNIFRSFGYLFEGSKAKRAYNFGYKILNADINTPTPVAYIELKSGPFVRNAYFISLPNHTQDLVPLLRRPDFDTDLVTRLAQFVVELHAKGIFHGDLNLSNILWNGNHFTLIDTNRTRFIAHPTRSIILKNIIRLTHRRDLLRAILSAYSAIVSSCATSADSSIIKTRLFDTLFKPSILDSSRHTDLSSAFIRDGLRTLLRRERTKHILHRIFKH